MKLFKSLLDIIYPPRCLICKVFAWDDRIDIDGVKVSICKGCYANFQPVSSPLCPICGRPFMSGIDKDHICEECLRKRPYYDAAAAPYLYEGAVRTAIYQFKYGCKRTMGDALGPLLARFAKTWTHQANDFLTVPVPLHAKRLRNRGFNQSLLLSAHVARRLQSDLDFLSLKRIKYTLPQTGLKRDERRKNVWRAFQVVQPAVFKKRDILLVDDVATTGNTLNECARVLKRAGGRKVFCLVLARATIPWN